MDGVGKGVGRGPRVVVGRLRHPLDAAFRRSRPHRRLRPLRRRRASGGQRWSLTTTLTAVTGGDACGVTFTPGRTVPWLMTLTLLGGGEVNVIVADERDPTDRYEYTGVIDRDTLTMAEGRHPGAMLCNGTRVDIETESRVEGTFADDAHTLLAQERVTARLPSGQRLTWFYEWRASWQYGG